MGVDVESTVWWGLVAPAGTPDDVVQKLNAALGVALNDPEVVEAMKKRGASVHPDSPAEFHAFMKKESATLSSVIEQAGIKVE